MTASSGELRVKLAAAYQLMAHFGMDDLTYTHISARQPGSDSFLIYPFGMLFEEVTASSLLEVALDGQVIHGQEFQYNKTGYTIHGGIYRNKPTVNAIFHLHTAAGIAVSALEEGLLPVSQFAFHFYENVGYHDYNSLALDDDHGQALSADLQEYNALFLRNHGTLTCGTTVEEAFFYAYYLEQACKVQCHINVRSDALILPSEEVCLKARQDMRNFEPNLGQRDWQALIRILAKKGSNYQS